MRIESDVKLDFRDVLIRPKRSVLKTRADVSLEREFRFRHTQSTWHGVPIIASNMDHTGTFAMASALAEHAVMTALGKYIPLSEWKQFAKTFSSIANSLFISLGIAQAEIAKLDEVMSILPVPF